MALEWIVLYAPMFDQTAQMQGTRDTRAGGMYTGQPGYYSGKTLFKVVTVQQPSHFISPRTLIHICSAKFQASLVTCDVIIQPFDPNYQLWNAKDNWNLRRITRDPRDIMILRDLIASHQATEPTGCSIYHNVLAELNHFQWQSELSQCISAYFANKID